MRAVLEKKRGVLRISGRVEWDKVAERRAVLNIECFGGRCMGFRETFMLSLIAMPSSDDACHVA